MSAVVCPFSRLGISSAERPVKDQEKRQEGDEHGVGKDREQVASAQECERQGEEKNGEAVKLGDDVKSPGAAKCPLGYDSGSFKIGPLSCVICRALLFESCRCVPCGHIYCRGCVSQFQECPLCGADIKETELDEHLQQMVNQFIEGHARIKRPTLNAGEDGGEEAKKDAVTYEDVSLARGSFLLQHALRAFQARNLESAKARLTLCVEDTKEELERDRSNPTVSSQLGAVLGMLGDCCRAMGDTDLAITHYERSVQLLEDLSQRDSEMVHALSVSLNKLGDLRYYAEDLAAARAYYKRALDVRKNSLTDSNVLSAQVLDVAVSLAKVADVDRALGNEQAASEGFQEGIKTLESLSSDKSNQDPSLKEKWTSVLSFLRAQLPTQQ